MQENVTVELDLPKELLENARALRKTQTDAEEYLWLLLRGRKLNGLKFRRQHPLSVGFILDFYCAEKRLGIEVDGEIHNLRDNIDYDEYRTEEIKVYNIHIIRFTNKQVLDNTFYVLKLILNECK